VGPEVREVDLRDAFGRFGKLKGLTLLSKSHCAFVDFLAADAAAAARHSLNGAAVRDSMLAVEFKDKYRGGGGGGGGAPIPGLLPSLPVGNMGTGMHVNAHNSGDAGATADTTGKGRAVAAAPAAPTAAPTAASAAKPSAAKPSAKPSAKPGKLVWNGTLSKSGSPLCQIVCTHSATGAGEKAVQPPSLSACRIACAVALTIGLNRLLLFARAHTPLSLSLSLMSLSILIV